MNEVNIESLIETLQGIADEEQQRRSWIEGREFYPGITELLSMVFDSANVGSSLDDGSIEGQLPHDAVALLMELDKYIHDHVFLHLPYDQVATSPKMADIRRIARELLVILRANP